MADLSPIYLVHGEDGAKIDEWRSRVVRRAEAELGPGGCERFDPTDQSPEDLAAATAMLTLAAGTRYLMADDAGAWKAPDLDPLLSALATLAPGTVCVLIVRGKPSRKLLDGVAKAGGEVREYPAPKPWELPKWVAARAADLGLRLDPDAAKALVALVGTGQQRLAREIEKLAIAVYPETRAGLEQVERYGAGNTTPRVYDLADAVVSGDLISTLALAEGLASHDERPSRLVYPVANRLREVHRAVELLEAGLGEKELASRMKAPPWRIKKTVSLARKADGERLRRAICRFAELELELRGGGSLDEETAVTLSLARAASA